MAIALTRPEVVLTHESDLDGFVSGHLLQRLARHLYGVEVRLEAWNTQAWRQRPMRESAAWVCDLAMDSRLDRPQWLVVDHHPPEAAAQSARLVHDPEKSATWLAYDLCRQNGLSNPTLDRLVELTDIGDLFREAHPDFDLAQNYASLVKTYGFWNLSKLIEGDLERLLDHPLLQVIQTKRAVEDPLGLAWSRSRVVELSPTVGYVEVVVGNSNLIVHELLRDASCKYEVLTTLLRKSSSGVVASFRSRNGQAAPLARKLQGGGHPNAAGATLPRSIQSLPDAVEYLRRILNPPAASLTALTAPVGGLQM